MQQFIADRHTTPATPALNPVNVHIVPIYDTIADAESDLSNLEVGQILKTKDAGLVANLNPIDEVKQGVFLPPTSNAVAESLSYSTTEQKTGGKFLVNGTMKDVYCKMFVADNVANQTVLIENCSALVEAGGVWNAGGASYAQFPHSNAYCSWDSSDNKIRFVGAYTSNIKIWIRYTKNE